MDWTPIPESQLRDQISDAEARMSPRLYRFWTAIRIDPRKWVEKTCGMAGGGFWVVGLLGQKAIWYNDIEEGFNLSSYASFGELDEYWCNQDELEVTVQGLLNFLDTGMDNALRCGAPVGVDIIVNRRADSE